MSGSVERFALAWWRRVRVRWQRLTMPVLLARLRRRNRHEVGSVLGDAPVAVSLTTHGPRSELVFYVIEAIGRGRARPRRLILWLDDPAIAADPPESLRRLQRRGLEIALTENYGPHTKYYPYVASIAEHTLPLVTADDDVLYPRRWLSDLLHAAPQPIGTGRPAREVVCHRARRIVVEDGRLAPYDRWDLVTDTRPTVRNLATGVGGVLYPPQLLDELRAAGLAFRDCCPRADDIWLHAVALRSGYRARQIRRLAQDAPYVPFGKEVSLWPSNVLQGGNDTAVAATYTAADVAAIAAPPADPTPAD